MFNHNCRPVDARKSENTNEAMELIQNKRLLKENEPTIHPIEPIFR